MIKREELIYFQKTYGLPLSTIEKDYILGLILWGLRRHPILHKDWIFKGGTCLKKCYFGDYRFSEDLDYTLLLTASIDIEVIRKHLKEAFTLVQDNFGLMVTPSDIEFKPLPDKKGLFIQVKVPYQGSILSSGSLPRIKLDLSQEETLVDQSVEQQLIHPYSDQNEVQTKIRCYSLEEIFAEKLRAFVERTRPRDLYDIVNLYTYFRTKGLEKETFFILCQKKFKHKSLLFPEVFIDLDKKALAMVKVDWGYMLSHQLQPLGEVESYLNKYEEIKEWLV